MQQRLLKAEERDLIALLLEGTPEGESLIGGLSCRLVEEMADGGMGGVRFTGGGDTRRYGRTLAEGEFCDTDGVVVSVALNLDKSNDLYELDLWKVDFSRLIRIPPPTEIKIVRKK